MKQEYSFVIKMNDINSYYMMNVNQKLLGLLKPLIIVAFLMQLILLQPPSNCSILNCSACSNTSDTNCSACQAGFTLAGVTCCNSAILNCTSCLNDSNICDSCVSSSYCLSNSTCVACSSILNSCSTCANCTACLTCISNLYAINSSSSECQLCTSLMINCQKCSSQSVCTNCINNLYAVNPTSHKCQVCSTFLSNCTNCNSATICTACKVDPNIVLSTNSKCLPCGSVMAKCLNCTKYNYCTLCSSYYAIKYVGTTATCYSCSSLMVGCLNCSSSTVCTSCSLGYIVFQGCSSVPGCMSVIQTPPTSPCQRCNYPEFQLNPVNGSCVCSIGHLAGRYCTLISGCTNIVRTSTIDYCSACNSATNFVLDSRSCSCRQYFQPSGTICTQICGDGKLFLLPCDDGNLIDGDGCSSSCQIEKGYRCQSGTNHTQSSCYYEGKMTMTLSCVNNLGGNTGNIVFIITPFISNFVKSNLDNHIIFKSNGNCTMTTYNITSNKLYIFFKFQNDVENTEANVTLKYDAKYIVSPQSIANFTLVQCNGNKLLFDSESSQDNKKTINTILRLIGVLAWIGWLFGSYSHKMIGVETLHTIQLIFIMQVYSARYYPVVVYFNELNTVLNAFQRFFITAPVVVQSKSYFRLGLCADFLNNMEIISFAQIFSVLLFFLLLYLEKKSSSQINIIEQASKNVENEQTTSPYCTYRTLVYNCLVFPLFIGTYFYFFIVLMIHENIKIKKQSSRLIFDTLIAVFVAFPSYIILFKQWKNFIMKQKNGQSSQNMKSGYIPLYLFNVFVLSIITHLTLSQMIIFRATYVIGAAEFLNAVIILAYRPYMNSVHSIGLLINQVGVLLNVFWIISQDYFYLNKQNEQMVAFSLIGYIFFIICWSFVRTVVEIKTKRALEFQQSCKKSKKRKKPRVAEQDEIVKAILKENQAHKHQYYLNSQLLKRKEQNYTHQFNVDSKLMNDEPQSLKKNKKILRSRFNYKYKIEPEQNQTQ